MLEIKNDEWKIAKINEKEQKKIDELEQELGIVLIAYDHQDNQQYINKNVGQ